jgi:DNA-binding transcriptional regulator GbsR (MarR family)
VVPKQRPQNTEPDAPGGGRGRPDPAENARTSFVDGMGGVGEFWGIAPAMGRIWAVLYLNQDPMTMDGVVAAVGITKGHASTNLRALLRLGLITKSWRPGDRKEYYSPQADLWDFARSILKERQKQEFDQALASTRKALAVLEADRTRIPIEEYRFLKERLEAIRDFHGTIDRAVAAVLAFEDLRHAVLRLAPDRGARQR